MDFTFEEKKTKKLCKKKEISLADMFRLKKGKMARKLGLKQTRRKRAKSAINDKTKEELIIIRK